MAPAALGQRGPFIEAEQRLVRGLQSDVAQLRGRRVLLDHDRDVLQRLAKILGDRPERLVDQLLEGFACHRARLRPSCL